MKTAPAKQTVHSENNIEMVKLREENERLKERNVGGMMYSELELINNLKNPNDRLTLLMLFLCEYSEWHQHLKSVGQTWGADGEEIGAGNEIVIAVRHIEKIKDEIKKILNEKEGEEVKRKEIINFREMTVSEFIDEARKRNANAISNTATGEWLGESLKKLETYYDNYVARVYGKKVNK